MKYVALGLAVAYMIAFIAVGLYYIIPWLSIPVAGVLGFNLWQIIGIILYFTAGVAGFIYSIYAIIAVVVWNKVMQ